jgi:tripartite-type tricarboxylate transporter receptor subunit TctC
MLMRALKTECLIVQHKGNAPAGLEVIAGRMAFHIDSIATGLEQHRSGKVRAIAVTSPKRIATAPEIPAIAETIPGFDAATWAGLVGPKGLPEIVLIKVKASIAQALQDEQIAARLRDLGTEPSVSTVRPLRTCSEPKMRNGPRSLRALV